MKNQRKLYKIGYLCDLLGITPRTIRFYDQSNLLQHVKRSEGGIRLFDDEDIEIIKKIRHMQKKEFLPLDVIRERLFGKKTKEEVLDKIVLSDSTISLAKELQKELNVEIIPLKIIIDGKTFLDGQLTSSQLLEKSNNLQTPVLTAPPSEQDFIEKYLELAEKGYKVIYSINLSGNLSGTYITALSAAHKVADRVNVHVIDSKSAGPGHRSLVIDVANKIKENSTEEEIEVYLTKNISLGYVLMVSNTIKHLFRGINVEKFPYMQKQIFEKLFDFRPLLALRAQSGELEVLGWHKEKKQAIENMVEILQNEVVLRGGYVKRIYIDYNYLYGEAIELINTIKNIFTKAEVVMQEGSSVFSTYLGPQTIAISIS